LVKNNALVGAEIATAVSNISSNSCKVSINAIKPQQLPKSEVNVSRVVCVGGSVIDIVAKPNGKMILGTSNPGKINQSDGGVCRNIAETLGRLGTRPVLYTAVGSDEMGRGLVERLQEKCGVSTTPTSINVVKDASTAQYYALNDHESALVGAIADMDVLAKIPIPSVADLAGVEYLLLDANLPAERILEASKCGVQAGCKVCFEPTSVPKSQALMQLGLLPFITYTFPNEDELFAMAEILDSGIIDRRDEVDDGALKKAALVLLKNMKDGAQIIITLGERGVVLATSSGGSRRDPVFKHFPADTVSGICSSNGPGDTFCGAFIHALLNGTSDNEAVIFAMKAAVLSLKHESSAISPHLSSLGLDRDSP
jgi:pseudouridine kinase